ncbi:hypothetical protein M3Y97_00114500 [Aphelenchoides bicaudatus]|nr:hypothetical protein M3Y97_00114500 [Aphelenchoides bicaudatus]
MEDPDNWFKCLVCSEKTRFFHLEAQICRSCANFVRRVFNEDTEYQCERDGTCSISMSRTSCRSCRFQQTLKAGVCLDALRKSNEPNVRSKPKSKQILEELVNAYENFMTAQRSLHLALSPEIGLDDKKLILAQKKQIVDVERKTLPIIVCFFNEHFGPFKNLKQDQKIKVISDTLGDFGILHRAYLTSLFFPDEDDSRVCFTNAYYMLMDPNLIEWFFDGYIPLDRIDEHLNIVAPLVKTYQKNIIKFKKLEARKVDVVVLMAFALWKRIELANLLNEDLIEYKERIILDWTKNLNKTYGPKDGNLRLAKFMQFFFETDDLANEFQKIVTLLNLNSLAIGKDQLCEVIEHLKTLDL